MTGFSSRSCSLQRGKGSGVPFEELPNWEVIWFAEGLVTRRLDLLDSGRRALEAAGLSE